MTLFYGILFFALGTLVASFVGVVVARLNTGKSFVRGRSECDACGVTLPALALVPVISYIYFGGRTNCCGTRLSWLSPISELLLGGFFALSYMKVGLSLILLPLFIALALLFALVLYDAAHQILPPVLLFSFVAIVALYGYLAAPDGQAFLSTFLVAVLIGGFFALIYVLSRGRAIGLSDAPLVFALALLVGPQLALAGLAFSVWIGAGIGITLLLKRPVGSRMGVEVPFAPFLAAGFLLAYFTQWNPFALIAVLPW